MLYRWDFRSAERAFQRAIELNPGYANAHKYYGQLLAATGRREAALAEHQRALELDPNSLLIRSDFAFVLVHTGYPDEAIAQARKVLEVDPSFEYARNTLVRAYTQKRMYEEAIAEGRPSSPWLGYAYAAAGKRKEAEQVIDKLKALSEERYVSPHNIAGIHAGLGEKEPAFEWLYKAYEGRAQGLIWLKTDPRYQSLRADPRFVDLVRRVGLPP